MPAPDWIDHAQASVIADSPLHAGITVDLLRGNLYRIYEQQLQDCAGYPLWNDQLQHLCGAAGVWSLLNEWPPMPVRLNRDLEGSLKPIYVDLFAQVTGGVNGTIRAILAPYAGFTPAVDATTGDISGGYAASIVFPPVAGYAWGSCTISPLEARNISADSACAAYPYQMLYLTCKSDGGPGNQVRVRAARIRTRSVL